MEEYFSFFFQELLSLRFKVQTDEVVPPSLMPKRHTVLRRHNVELSRSCLKVESLCDVLMSILSLPVFPAIILFLYEQIFIIEQKKISL